MFIIHKKRLTILVGLFYLITNIAINSLFNMKVVRTTDDTHSIRFIPRFYNLDDTTLQLTNEATKAVEDVAHEIAGTDSIITLIFDYDFTEGERFQIKLYNDTEDLYRGRLIATDQTVQEYDTTKEYYTYE